MDEQLLKEMIQIFTDTLAATRVHRERSELHADRVRVFISLTRRSPDASISELTQRSIDIVRELYDADE